jgi:hypothetical protein
MNAAAVLRRIVAAGETAAAAAEAAVVARAIAQAEAVPGLAAQAGSDGVQLRGRGLLARAFGSRRRAADPRIASLGRGEMR